ncbi:hypothetical protein WICANDRAFT_61511 [Wickerhamomyces anomalus NRRL Y-366-8]|uniref:HTH CENPB-type domain-containing protein n=1 Tax=Wickerhamomyces anomalus (strain ATCC 58044 / CBS 1984 / NCYC 433 / NRRL Y-366-8) TaxID=683960 RepID=A0A1E3P6A9_WICAA|nr:uncharacterized protein WICANDRAFT_61511 [Wickerhamomyces anomalus NRRL Y-366-8]ODQ60951.1 hypothetical protein WICANDRAFT_61511 [Wickerhamomyces anomalus NRRL Y-366-8]
MSMLMSTPQCLNNTSGIATNSYKVSKPKTKPRTTLEEKIMILNHYHQSNKPQADTVELFKNRYSISTSSFSEWLKDEESLRNLYNNSNEFLKKSKRKLRFKYDKINEEMDKLVEERIQNKKPINEPFLRENWAIFANRYGVEDPKRLLSFSHGWLSQFKKRHGLDKQSRMRKLSTTSLSSPNCDAASITSDTSSSTSSTDTLVETSNNTNITNELENMSGINPMKPSISTQSFLNLDVNEDYLQTNINNYENLINNASNNFMPIQISNTPTLLQSASLSRVNSRPLQSNSIMNSSMTNLLNFANTSTTSSSTNNIEYDLINEGDFEIFLNKYGEDFLGFNQDKYPESFKILGDLKDVFKKEKEGYNDKKLRELLFRR